MLWHLAALQLTMTAKIENSEHYEEGCEWFDDAGN
jgi:hypothetical protein